MTGPGKMRFLITSSMSWAGCTVGMIMLGLLTGTVARAADAQTRTTTTAEARADDHAVKLHAQFQKEAAAGHVDLLFLGDSITGRMRGTAVWNKYYAPLKAANFGIDGDRTQNLLWRLQNGELDGIQPKVAVLLIGTNNGESSEDVALGVKAILDEIRHRTPKTKTLLLAIFPLFEKDGSWRKKNEQTNKIIATYANGKDVVFLDIGDKFLAPDGTILKDLLPDLLHPSEMGYAVWAEAIKSTLKAML